MSVTSIQAKPDIWENDLLTIKEVAAYLRVSRVTVWRWCQQGLIPASRVGHHWRISRANLLSILDPPQPPNFVPLQSSPSFEHNGKPES